MLLRRELLRLSDGPPTMTDLFALLGEPRRPALDPVRIKETFHRLSRTEHPDQQASPSATTEADFAQLNLAQTTLRDPKTRLRHLLELEFPSLRLTGPSTVPPTLADLFAPTHALLRETDALLSRKTAAPSALSRALLAREEWTLRERAETTLANVESLHASALADLQAFDAAWDACPPDAAARLHDLYQRFSYLGRWAEQLRERLFVLGV